MNSFIHSVQVYKCIKRVRILPEECKYPIHSYRLIANEVVNSPRSVPTIEEREEGRVKRKEKIENRKER